MPSTFVKSEPKQARSKETYERILAAAQDLLEASGIEAFNTNAVVDRAGMTPPALYRWFPNKHVILEVLSERLMAAQNVVIEEHFGSVPLDAEAYIEATKQILEDTIEVTQRFGGGHTLLVAMRAIPVLQPVRLSSHNQVSKLLSERLIEAGYQGKPAEMYARSRLCVETGYAAIEMLFETGFKNRKVTIDACAHSHATILQLQ